MKISHAIVAIVATIVTSQVNCGSNSEDVTAGVYGVGGAGGGGTMESSSSSSSSSSSGTVDLDAGVVEDAAVDVMDAALWTPQSLIGLSLWLDATKGVDHVNGAVQRWADQSGNMNDATSALTTSVAPTLVMQSIGGNPAVRIDGTNYFAIKDAESLQFGTGDFVLALVARHTTPTTGPWGYGIFYNKQESPSPFLGPCMIGNTVGRTTQLELQVSYQIASVITVESGLNTGQPMLVVMHRKGTGSQTSLEVRLNGAPSAMDTGSKFAVNVSALGQPVQIGGTPSKQNIVGDIAEVIAVKGAVPDEDMLALEGYLKTKYGL